MKTDKITGGLTLIELLVVISTIGVLMAMSASSLQMALVKLRDLHLTMQQVRRVAIERQGEIYIEVHEAGRQRFFIFEANRLRELQPENDRKIPFLVNWSESYFSACLLNSSLVTFLMEISAFSLSASMIFSALSWLKTFM